MADDWELAHGLNPANAEDGQQVASAEGYTALEVYLNSLMGEKIEMTTTAIRTIHEKAAGEVVGREYFTADGRQTSRLQHGLNIVRERMADGSVRTVKVMTR